MDATFWLRPDVFRALGSTLSFNIFHLTPPFFLIDEQVTFDPFNIRQQISWKSVMDWFWREVQFIENEAKHFIDESFKSLRSAEGAYDMLLNFQHIRYTAGRGVHEVVGAGCERGGREAVCSMLKKSLSLR